MNEDHFAGKAWIFISFISTWKKLFFSTHERTADPFFRRCHGAVPGGWAGSSLAVFKDMGWCEVETSEQMGSRWEFPMVNMDVLWRSHKFQYVHLMAVAKFHGMDPSKNGSGCGTLAAGRIHCDPTWQAVISVAMKTYANVCYHLPWWSWFSISK